MSSHNPTSVFVEPDEPRRWRSWFRMTRIPGALPQAGINRAFGPKSLERCSQHPDAQGRKRLIPYSPFEICHSTFSPVAINLNNMLKKTIIRLAAEVAGLKFGKEVVVEF